MRHLKVVGEASVDVSEDVGATLGPTQARVLAKIERAGISLDDAFARLGEIVRNGEAEVALVGIRLLMDYTIGRPPARGSMLIGHVSGKSDTFFRENAATFEKPPPPRIEG